MFFISPTAQLSSVIQEAMQKDTEEKDTELSHSVSCFGLFLLVS